MKVIIVGLGIKTEQGTKFKSSFVRDFALAIQECGVETLEYYLENTKSLFSSCRDIIKLRKQIFFHNPVVVHAQYGSTTAFVSLIASFRRAPLIVSFCGSDLLGLKKYGMKKKVKALIPVMFSYFTAIFARQIIVKSQNLFDVLPKYVQKKTKIQANGVNLKMFRAYDRMEARKRIAINHNRPLVIFNESSPGSEEIKCHFLAHRTIQSLKEMNPDVDYLGLNNIPHEEVFHYLNAADVLLLTSVYEGSPNIIKEAMACNLPVVSVACGDVSLRLCHVFPGAIVDRDPVCLAQYLQNVIKSQCRSNGRNELIRQGLSVEAVCARFKVWYDLLSKDYLLV